MAFDVRVDHRHRIRAALTDIDHVLSSLGLLDGSQRQAGGRKVLCPMHQERSPSCSVKIGRDGTIAIHCFGCGEGGDIFTLIGAVRGLDCERDFPRILEEAAELAGLRDIAEELRGRGGERREPAPAPPPRPKPLPRAPERTYPPIGEISAVWRAAAPVIEAEAVANWLRGRGLDPKEIAANDIARALPPSTDLPRWASYKGDAPEPRSWRDLGHLLLLPVYDARGTLRSVRAGRVTEGSTPKRLPPSGHLASGLVLADSLAVAMLSGGGLRGDLLVVEGEPDFLTWAAQVARQNAPVAVIGVGSGSWTRAHAKRVPEGTRVVIRTHRDTAGDKYAAEIGFTLARRCTVLRPEVDGVDGDENDRLRAGTLAARHADGAVPMAIETVDPRSFLLGRLFAEYGWLDDELVVWEDDGREGKKIRAGVFAARCPSEELHDGGERFDGRTVVECDGRDGLFRCNHPQCRRLYESFDQVVMAMQRAAEREGL